MANQSYSYVLTNGKTMEGMINSANYYLSVQEKMETQIINGGTEGSIYLQAKAKHGVLRSIIGVNKAMTVRFLPCGNNVTVEFGEAKWGDKAVVMTISMFVLWPLAISSGIGIAKQAKLPGKVKAEIDRYMEMYS